MKIQSRGGSKFSRNPPPPPRLPHPKGRMGPKVDHPCSPPQPFPPDPSVDREGGSGNSPGGRAPDYVANAPGHGGGERDPIYPTTTCGCDCGCASSSHPVGTQVGSPLWRKYSLGRGKEWTLRRNPMETGSLLAKESEDGTHPMQWRRCKPCLDRDALHDHAAKDEGRTKGANDRGRVGCGETIATRQPHHFCDHDNTCNPPLRPTHDFPWRSGTLHAE